VSQVQIEDARNVYQIAYSWEPNGYAGRWNIEFAVIKGLKEHSCDRLSVECQMVHSTVNHWEAGVSGTLMFSQPHVDSDATERDLTFLERNVGDLITMYATDAARTGDAIILIAGPPLPGLVGRIAYRCLNRKTIIAFVTWMNPICHGPRFKAEGSFNAVYAKWSGPFPVLHEDSLTRAFYNYTREERSMIPVRLDILTQPIGVANPGEDILSTLTQRLEVLDQIICHKGAFRFPSGQIAYIPQELGRLFVSLRWNDTKFKTWLSENRTALVGTVGEARLNQLISEGVLTIEPRETLAARFGSADTNYIRERLFEELEWCIAAAGPEPGTCEFLKQDSLLAEDPAQGQ
jgi:hypothetical protein